MSAMDVFSLRYLARIGCGQFDADLHLHDYKGVREQAERRSEPEAEILNAHVTEEKRLRDQVATAIETANARRTVKDLPRKASERLSDVYAQTRRGDLAAIAKDGLRWVFDGSVSAPSEAPIFERRWSKTVNVIAFDFVEAFFDHLPPDEQLEFSRDLNHRLHTGGSPWFFQLGRWRRDDWPRERDSTFDQILHALKLRADDARERSVNVAWNGRETEELSEAEAQSIREKVEAEEARAKAAYEALERAANRLWNADRLLSSDLLSPGLRHDAAVKSARAALDLCLQHFEGGGRGPFIKVKAPREERRRGFGFHKPRKDDAPASLTAVQSPLASAIRIKQLGQALTGGAPHLDKETREAMLSRAPLAEMLLRLALIGVSDEEDGGEREVKLYSRATAGGETGPLHLPGPRLNHGAATLPLKLEDEQTARLAVDTLAKLCLYATGSAAPGEETIASGLDPLMLGPHPRARDAMRARRLARLGAGAVLMLVVLAALGAAFSLGAVFGPQLGLLG